MLWKTRNQPQAWRPLGYIPTERIHYSNAQWGALSKEYKSIRLNLLYKTVLTSFIEAQKPGALDDFELNLGGFFKIVNLKVPLAFIIGDVQGGDSICGHPAYYNQDAQRISRMCDATPECYSSKIVKNCNLLKME